MRRSPSVPLAVAALAGALACAPKPQSAADSVAVPATTAESAAATATPLPAAPDSSGSTATAASPKRAAPAHTAPARTPDGTATSRGGVKDTGAGPRMKPPTKAPGGYIIVPRTAHDSLRMAPPAGTATRP